MTAPPAPTRPPRDVALIDDLRALRAATAWVEFKHENTDPDSMGKRVSALSNAARIEGQDTAYMVWGVEDGTHHVLGTSFEPDATKARGQPLPLWLAQSLQPSPAFGFRVVAHTLGRLVLLEIPAAPGAPVCFQNIPYVRIGSATPKLTDYPERFQRLIERLRPYRWESEVARAYVSADEVLTLLDYPAYFRLTRQPLPDNRVGILEKLAADRFITADVGGQWNITNLGAIVLAARLSAFDPGLSRKGVRMVAYGGPNRAATVTHRHDEDRGYAAAFEALIETLTAWLPRNEHIGAALREAHPLFPALAIRELLANALIHQDMTITGAGPQVEVFGDRIEITNPGRPLVAADRMIDLPPRSRNEALSSLMRRMGFCEEQGSGLDKVLSAVELFQLPPPLFQPEDGAMRVVLYGPRSFADMTPDERVRACYFHAVLKFLSGEKMKNATLCARLGIDAKNASQASQVIGKALEAGLIRVADPDHPRAGYVPKWA
jgi:predicted HTH transcriptional regulator